jgi:cobalamin biosynthesis Co2+ chelatase CbiK|tara:strand:+ start:85 stop:273 length:189 start_codon:yes stop_codon:yes gene_type:complete
MIKVTIADKSGHTELMMDSEQLTEVLAKNTEAWIFVDGQLVNNVDVENVEAVTIMPAMVGGI